MSFATKPAAAAIDMTPSNRRFLVMALLFVTVVINYLDRSNLSIAAPSILAGRLGVGTATFPAIMFQAQARALSGVMAVALWRSARTTWARARRPHLLR